MYIKIITHKLDLRHSYVYYTIMEESFAKTQKIWYDKLKKEGFNDLEWINHATGAGQNGPYLKESSPPINEQKMEEHINHFAKCSRYLHYGKFKTPLHKKVWAMYCEGISYRNMMKKLKKEGKNKYIPSIFWISMHINQMINECAFYTFKEDLQDEIEPESIDYLMRTNKRAF